MAKTFELNFNKGSVVERYNGYTPSTNCPMKQTSKGMGISAIRGVQALVYESGGKVPFGTGSWTIEFWARNDFYGSTTWYFGQGGSSVQGVNVYSSGGSGVYCGVEGTSGSALAINNAAFPYKMGEMYHIVITCDRTNNLLTVYTNGLAGTPVSIATVVGSLTRTGSPTGFMTYQSVNNDTITGEMAMFRLYNTVLTTAEINAGYAEFLAAQPINKPKRGFIQNKPTDLSRLVGNTLTEQITVLADRDFSSDTGYWTKPATVTISGGATHFTNTPAYSGLQRNSLLTIGKKYRVSFTVSNYVSGSIAFQDGVLATSAASANGSYVFEYTAGNTIGFFATLALAVNTFDIDNVSVQEVTGLVAAYNMQKVGNTLVDISGNGNNGTIIKSLVSTKNGLQFNSDGYIDTTSGAYIGTGDFSISARLRYSAIVSHKTICGKYTDSATAGILFIALSDNTIQLKVSNGVNSITVNTTLTYTNKLISVTAIGSRSGNIAIYVDGVLASSLVSIVSASGDLGRIRYIGNDAGLNYKFDGEIADLRIHNRVLTQAEITAYHNSFVLPTLVEDFSDAGADGITKTDAPAREWERVSGTWKVGQITTADPVLPTITSGTKYLECVTAGTIAIPSNTAYGTWEWDWYKGADTNQIILSIVSGVPFVQTATSYYFVFGGSETLGMVYNSNILYITANAYLSNNTWYRMKITRSNTGVFTTLIKGGAFTPTAGYDGWTLLSVSGGAGSNPVTDTTTTTSNYFVVNLSAGDRVANIAIRDGIKV